MASLNMFFLQDSYCSSKNATAVVKTIKAYFNVTTGDDQALKVALAQHGPISVAIDAAVRSFSFYANGVYDDPKCGKYHKKIMPIIYFG